MVETIPTPAMLATKAITRICCRSSPVERRNRTTTAMAVEIAAPNARAVPRPIRAPAHVKPSIPSGFAYTIPSSRQLL
jgi:hypothetical protein